MQLSFRHEQEVPSICFFSFFQKIILSMGSSFHWKKQIDTVCLKVIFFFLRKYCSNSSDAHISLWKSPFARFRSLWNKNNANIKKYQQIFFSTPWSFQLKRKCKCFTSFRELFPCQRLENSTKTEFGKTMFKLFLTNIFKSDNMHLKM